MNWKNWTGSATFWKTLPTSSFLIFLAAVFCLFASLGFILDSRNPHETGASELALNVLVRSLFAVCWAFLGVRRMFKSMIRNCGWANVPHFGSERHLKPASRPCSSARRATGRPNHSPDSTRVLRTSLPFVSVSSAIRKLGFPNW